MGIVGYGAVGRFMRPGELAPLIRQMRGAGMGTSSLEAWRERNLPPRALDYAGLAYTSPWTLYELGWMALAAVVLGIPMSLSPGGWGLVYLIPVIEVMRAGVVLVLLARFLDNEE